MRGVLRYTPEFEKRWRRYEKPVGLSWRVDETYIKVAGEWTYLYRAVDSDGRAVDLFLSKRRDVHAAKVLFRRALRKHGDPLSITLDAYATSHRAIHELKESGEIFYQKMRVRSCAYLNDVFEQDHRRVKKRVLGFQSFDNARIVIGGIEFAEKIKKRQYDLRRLRGNSGELRRDVATRSGCVKATQDNHTPTALFIASCRCLQRNHRFHVPRKMRTLRTHCSRYGWARSRPIAPSSTSCWACGVLQQNSRGASLLFASFKLLRLSCSPAVFLSAEPLTSCPARPIGSSQQMTIGPSRPPVKL